MDTRLFTSDSIWTMVHGIALGGGALLALGALLFALRVMRPADVAGGGAPDRSGALVGLAVTTAVLLWAAVIVGTYVIFPPYRATPPEGLADLSQYPRALLRANPGTAWLHNVAMEIKEHVPWIAAMLGTAVAAMTARYRARVLSDAALNRAVTAATALCFVFVAVASLLGVFVNKVAPLD